jgi:hypothetical protein
MTQDPLPADEWAAETSDQVEEPDKPPPKMLYANLAEFVECELAPMYQRPIDDDGRNPTWCPDWWKHREAQLRLDVLWRAFEHLRLDGKLGLSTWLRDHVDHHMPILLDTNGPLHGCNIERGHSDRLAGLICNPPPPHLFGA